MLRSRKNVVRSGGKKGFTLVELLIVIVVIGVLSAMMMLSSTEAVSSAKANNIISNMRNIKTAVLSWYTDNLDRIKMNSSKQYQIDTNGTKQHFSNFIDDHASEILAYLNNDSSIIMRSKNSAANNTGDYTLAAVNNAKQWYICCNLGTPATSLKEKIASRAKSLGLLGSIEKLNDTAPTADYTNQKFVCLPILTLE